MKALQIGIAMMLILILLIASVPAVISQKPEFNWVSPAANLQNTNTHQQNSINNNNVDNLVLSWIYQVPEDPFKIPYVAPSLGLQTAPLIVNGIAYIATFYNRIIAINAETGPKPNIIKIGIRYAKTGTVCIKSRIGIIILFIYLDE